MLTGLALLAMAPAASAIGLSGTAAPDDLTAGAHSDFDVHIDITDAPDDLKDLTIHLPPGMVGDPNATPKCSLTQLNAASCPANTQVGTSSTVANIAGVPIPGITQVTVNGGIFNIAPQPGEPARFGIVLQPAPPLDTLSEPIVLQSGAALRQDDFGLDTVLTNLPNTATVLGLDLPIDIVGLDISLSGEAGNPLKPFMRNPTSCDPKTVSFTATSYAGGAGEPVEVDAPSFTPEDCDLLPFSPELTASIGAPGQTAHTTHPPLTTVIAQAETEAGLARAEVILPESVEPNLDALGPFCTEAEFAAANCPAGSEVGTAEASSPLLTQPLTGTAYVLFLDSGVFGVGLDLTGELALKLAGSFIFLPDGRTGNLFEGLPDIPISNFELTIAGGPGGLLTAKRDLCDPPDSVLEADFDGHNGAQLQASSTATIEGCAPPQPPTASVRLKNKNSSHPRLRLKVTAGSEALRSARVRLPRGLRFAAPDAFAAGATASDDSGELPDDAIGRKKRKATVTIPATAGSDKVRLRARRGALIRTDRGPNKFKLKVTDVDGLVTKLTRTG